MSDQKNLHEIAKTFSKKPLPDSEIELTGEIPFEALLPLEQRALEGLAKELDLPGFRPGPGCTASDDPARPGVQHFICSGLKLTATVQVFPPRTNPGTLIAARRSAGADDLAEDVVTSQLAGAPAWQLVETEKPDRLTATALWIDGDPGLGGLAGRLRQARNSILGDGLAPVLMTVRIGGDGAAPMNRNQHPQARAVIRAFIDAQDDLQAAAIGLAQAAVGR